MILPSDYNIECDILGTMLRYNEYFAKYGDMLTEQMFYDSKNAAIFRHAQDIVASGGITDMNRLRQSLQAERSTITTEDIAAVLTHCAEMTLEQNIRSLRMMYKKRKAWEIFTRASESIISPVNDVDMELDNIAESLAALTAQETNDGICTFNDAFNEVANIVEANQQGKHSFIPCGFRVFDNHYLLRPRSMTIIAAFPAVGKSSLALNIALNVAKNGYPVAIYSLEMGKSELAARAASAGAGMTAGRILNSNLYNEELSSLARSFENLRGLPIYIDERSNADWSRTMRSIRKMVAQYGVKLVVIDYLQIFAQTGDSSEASLSRYAREAKNIALELNISVIVVSQLNRSASHPSIRMLRGSGQIEESADNVVLIDRPEAYPDSTQKYEGEYSTSSTQGTAKIIIAKGRNVGIGCELVRFDGRYTRFYEEDTEAPFN